MSAHPIAVMCADLHLSATPPIWRAPEPNWFAAMQRPLDELGRFARRHGVPILCAGDVFHKWNPPPELINFAIDHLPEMFAVPGQHDLPYHVSEDVNKSAFGTLVKIGRIKMLGETPKLIKGAWVYGFGWGKEIEPAPPRSQKDDRHICVAIVHAYCWQNQSSYPGAKESHHVKMWRQKLAGYDAAAFGDNHKGFLREAIGVNILNCGGFMRRNSDQADYTPQIGLLYSDGTIKPHNLSTGADVFDTSPAVRNKEVDEAEAEMYRVGLEKYVRSLSDLDPETYDFAAMLKHYMGNNTLTRGVRDVLLEAIAYE